VFPCIGDGAHRAPYLRDLAAACGNIRTHRAFILKYGREEMPEKADEYRMKALWCLRDARDEKDPELKAALEKDALLWERMAEEEDRECL
jgi:hypothetical protein